MNRLTGAGILLPDRQGAAAVVGRGTFPDLSQKPRRVRLPAEGRALFGAFALLGVLLVSYIGWLVLGRGFSYSVLMNGWMPDSFELVVATLCLARGVSRRPGRAVALLLGTGLLLWCFGDFIWTAQSVAGSSSLSTALGAICWLGFYPFAYIAIVLFMRREAGTLTTPSWLDGAIAGLGTAALCSAFAFHGLGTPGNGALAEATNLAYPIGDLLLLGLVVGGTALLSGNRSRAWSLLALASLLNGVGDTFNLFQSSEGHLRLDAFFHVLAWPSASLLMALAVWLRPRPADLQARHRSSGLVLPGVASAAGVLILISGSVHRIGRIPLALAIATLTAGGIRLVWSAHRLQALTEQRHRQSMTDELTGLGNRRYLFDVLDAFFTEPAVPEAGAERRLAFLFLDLNHFKEINDSFGHLAGDELLKQLGPRLAKSLRPEDILVRFGGDEFAVVLLDSGAEEASALAKQLTAALAAPFALERVQGSISASIGIACAPGDASDAAGLLHGADVAMYRAKLGRSPYACYDALLDTGNQWRLGEELRDAIERREFVLYYQPKLELEVGRIHAVEALVRWRHPSLGVLPPSRFLPLAEHAGLMPALTALLLDDALAQAARWRGEGRQVSMAVNISATNLLDEGFAELVEGSLARHRLPASALVLEITETSVIENFETSQSVIAALRDLGVVVSIDDFGAGNTSLPHLSSLAVGELKLDCKLITDLAATERERDRDLVRSTIELGHALGLRVVAEGVEDQATLELLRELGSDYAQGYFISRPVPAERVAFEFALGAELVAPGAWEHPEAGYTGLQRSVA